MIKVEKLKTNSQLELLYKSAPEFLQKIRTDGFKERQLTAKDLSTLQINIGRRCNQACKHCHVDSSPTDERNMKQKDLETLIKIIETTPEITTIDITGGAPEMHPGFMQLVTASLNAGKQAIDRCNLTILEEPGYSYLYEFLSSNKVEIIASLPSFRARNTDLQRGKGVFEKSIIALKKLNEIGYGKALPLNLVYNPPGFYLSAPQHQLEREFKENLKRDFGIVFNNLYCINNVPINRFLESLVKKDRLQKYMDSLLENYNICTLDNLMCRNQISISYNGYIYDCDFNQMLDIKATPIDHINNFDYDKILNRKIRTANHCYGCTAGSGSS